MITILTPTYNRESTLRRLYESLQSQDKKDFIWLIVDDGSTDSTEYLISTFKVKEKDFDIIYYKKENGGKHRAINYALPYIKTKFVLILDSDDYLTSDAVSKIFTWIDSIKGDQKCAGVSGLRGTSITERIGGFPKGIEKNDFIDAKNTERWKYNLIGDKAEVYRVDLLRRYKFPEFDGENFLAESVLWDKIALEGYYIRWFNSIIMITSYRNDGLTKNIYKKWWENFNGYSEAIKIEMMTPGNLRWRRLGRYILMAKKKNVTNKEIKEKVSINNFAFCIGYLISILIKFTDAYRK